MPQISIVVPVYNSAKYLSRTISSIQAQTYEDWEVLFIEAQMIVWKLSSNILWTIIVLN